MQFPSWDSDRREFVPTPLVDLTDGPAENDGGRNRVRASWGLSDAGATREWLSRFSLRIQPRHLLENGSRSAVLIWN